jgi:hypothetical protein
MCSVKPVLTEDLCVKQQEEFSITYYMCEIYTSRKFECIHKRQTHLRQRGCYIRTITARVQLGEKISGRGPQGA